VNGYELTNLAAAGAVSMALNSLWLSLLFAVLGTSVLRVLPRPNAATRYAIWLTVLVMVLAAPLIMLVPRPAPINLAAPVISAPMTVPVTVVWPVYATLLWLIVSTVLLGRIAWSVFHIHGLKRRAVLLARRDDIRILASAEVRTPMAGGFLHRAVIFPDSWISELKTDEFEQVLCHEMAHLRRGDDWTQLLQEIARAVFFFNPVIHWIGGRLAIEREMACDDWVVSSTGQARPYAACLTHLHELMRRRGGLGRAPQLAPGASIGKRRQLTTRVEALLEPGRNTAPHFSRSGWIAALAVAGVALLVATGTAPLATVQGLPLANLAVALPGGPAAPPISLTPRHRVAVRPHLLARRAGPELPSLAVLNDSFLPVRAWRVEISPTYYVITVVFFEPPPPAVLNGI
jgi:beta-lactamase regulating signal transducer with metallopeptidase domain